MFIWLFLNETPFLEKAQIVFEMQTQLAAQLQRIRVANADVTDSSSILFSPQEASRMSLQSIYSIGRNGIMELIRIDERFARFDDSLFGNKMLSVNRNHLTEKENEAITEQIRDYLFSVSPYMLLKCTQKTLEYLIRRFSIHTFNAEDFFLAVLPFHESPLFPRVFRILTLNSPIFNFLANSKKSETPIIRSTLSTQCLKDYAFLEYIIRGLRFLNEHNSIPVVHLTLICSIVVDITRYGSLKEEYVRTLIGFASSGFGSSNKEFQATSLLILAQISLNVQLSDDVMNACIKNLLKSPTCNMMQLAECLLIIFRTNKEYVMPEEIATLVLKNLTFEKTITTLALKVSVYPLIRSMVPALCSLLVGSDIFLPQLNIINKCVQEQDAMDYLQFMMSQLMTPSQNKQYANNIEKIMLSLSGQFTTLFDQYISGLSAECPLKTLSSRLFYGSSHMLLSNGRTLYLSMDCHEYSIRKEICTLLLKQIDEMGDSVDDNDLQFMKSSIPSLLQDDFFDITQQLLNADVSKLLRIFTTSEFTAILISLLERPAIQSQLREKNVQSIVISVFSLFHQLEFTQYVSSLSEEDRIHIITLFYSYYLVQESNDEMKKAVMMVILAIPSTLTHFKNNIKSITKERIVDALCQSFANEEGIRTLLKALPSLINTVSYCSLFFIEIALSLITKKNVTNEVKMSIGDIIVLHCQQQLQSMTTTQFKVTESDIKSVKISDLVSSSLYIADLDLAKFYLSTMYVIASSVSYSLTSLTQDYEAVSKQAGHPLSILTHCFTMFTPQTSFYMVLSNSIATTVWKDQPATPYCVILACCTNSTITLHSLNKVLTTLSAMNTLTPEVYSDLFLASFSHLNNAVMAVRSTCLMLLTMLVSKSKSTKSDLVSCLNDLVNAVMKFKTDIKDDYKLFTIKLNLLLSKQQVDCNRLSSILYPLVLKQHSLQQRVTYMTLFKQLPYVSSFEDTVLSSIQTTFAQFTVCNNDLVIEEWKLLLSLFFKAMTQTMNHQKEFRSLLYSFISTTVTVQRGTSVYSPITDVLRLINVDVFNSMNTPEKLSLLHAMFAVIPHHPTIDAIEVYKSIINLNIPLSLLVEEAKTLASTQTENEKEELIAIQFMTVFIEVITRDPRFNNDVNSIDPLLIILNRLVSIVKTHAPVKETATMVEQRAVEGAMEIESTLQDENIAIMSDTLAIFYPIQILLECLYSIIDSTTSNVRVIPEENSNPPSKRARRNSITIRTEIAIPPQVLVDLIHLNLTTQIKKTCLQLLSVLASIHSKEMDTHLFACFEDLASRVINQQDEESFNVIINILTYCLRRFGDQVQILRIYKTFLSCVPFIPYSHSIQLLNTLIAYSSSEYIGHITAYLLLLNNGLNIVKKETDAMEIEEDATRLQSSAVANSSIYHFISTMFMTINLLPQIRALGVLCCFAEIITENEGSENAYSNKTRDLTVYLMNSLPVEEWKAKEVNTIIISQSMLQFVRDIVSHTTFINKVATEKMNVNKSQQYFIQIIESLLLILQNCSMHRDRIGEESRGRDRTEEESLCLTKYRELEGCIYDSITVFSEVMNITTLLTILSVLMKHEDSSVRKRALVMLNKKIEDNIESLTTEEIHEFINFVDNLMEIWNDKNEQSVNKQTALLSFHILVQYFGADYSTDFMKCVKSILNIVTDTATSTPDIQALKGSAYIALSMLCSQLGIKMLPFLPVLLPSLLQELENSTNRLQAMSEEISILSQELQEEPSDSAKRALRERESQYDEICLLIQSLLSSLSSIVTYQGSLLSSFLQRIIVTLLSPILINSTKQAIKGTILILLNLLSEKIETRLLLPATYESYKKIDQHAASSIAGIFILLKNVFDRLTEETISSVYEKAWSFCVMGMELRGKWGVLNTDVDSVEKSIVDAMISITLKLNENQLSPLFMKTVNWMEEKTSASFDEGALPPISKVIPFLSLVIELSNTFKSIFTPFHTQFYSMLVEYLVFFNKTCKREKEVTEDQLSLYKVVKHVILTLYKCFLYDSNGWMDEEKFKLVSSPLIKCIGSYFIPNYETEYAKFMNNYVVPTCVQLIITTSGHDDWWQQYNHEVLIQTRSSIQQVKLVGIRVIKECFERMSQEYLPLLPDVIPFLADLLEDEDAEVEKAAQDLRVQLESISGEELTSYLTM